MDLRRITAAVNKVGGPEFDVVEVQPIGTDAARIVMQAHVVEGFSYDQWKNEIAAKFDGKVRLARGSLVLQPSTMNNVYNLSAHVIANAQSKAYTQEAAAGMKLVKANLFMDASDSLWRVVEAGGYKRLVQTAQDNFEEILSSRVSRRNGVYRLQASVANPSLVVSNSDYISYLNTQTRTVRCGQAVVAADKLSVFDRVSGQLVEIAPAQIASYTTNEKVEANLDDKSIQEHLQYMRQLYGDTEYFSALERILLGA